MFDLETGTLSGYQRWQASAFYENSSADMAIAVAPFTSNFPNFFNDLSLFSEISGLDFTILEMQNFPGFPRPVRTLITVGYIGHCWSR